jgi:hypothetical protein
MRLLALLIVGIILAPDPAQAHCAEYGWRRACNQDWPVPSCWRQRYCQRWAPDYERYYRSPREVILEREVENPRRHCEAPVHAVGLEKYGHERAKESADAQWAEAVRARMGGRHMDIRNAMGVAYECWQSSTGNRASEKTGEAVGGKLEQCEVRAVPCRAAREGAER